jgi:hypothetical protein
MNWPEGMFLDEASSSSKDCVGGLVLLCIIFQPCCFNK